MSGPRTQLEREEDALHRDYEAGKMTAAEYKQAYRELHRSYRDAAREAAEGAYEDEMERW